MIAQNKKQRYIEMIKAIKSDSAMAESAVKFIETYDSNNTDGFEALMASVITTLLEYEDAKIKADGYDKLMEIRGDFQKQMNVLKSELSDLEAGKLPVAPPTGANL